MMSGEPNQLFHSIKIGNCGLLNSKKIRSYLKNYHFHVIITISSVLAFFVISPVLYGGLYGDDTLNAVTRGYITITYHSLSNMIYQIAYAWAVGSARLYPLIFVYTYTFWYVIGDYIALAKLANIIAILSLGAYFAYLLNRIDKDNTITLLFTALLPVCIQLRRGFDPLSGFPLLIPIVLFIIFLQIHFIIKYMETNKYRYIFISSFTFLVGILTYELSFMALPLVFITIFYLRSTIRNILFVLAAYTSLIIPYIAVISSLRRHVPAYAGVDIVLSFQTVKSFLLNAYAAIPFTYAISDPGGVFSIRTVPFITIFESFIIASCYAAFLYMSLNRKNDIDIRSVIFKLIFGILLVAQPAFIYSLSKRYQSEYISLGSSYIQVLVESFGSAVIIAVFLRFILFYGYYYFRFTRIFASLIIAAGSAFSFCNNVKITSFSNLEFKALDRNILRRSISEGLLSSIPPQSSLIFDTEGPWLVPEFIVQSGEVNGASFHISSQASTIPISEGSYRIHVSLPNDPNLYDLGKDTTGIVSLSLGQKDGRELIQKVFLYDDRKRDVFVASNTNPDTEITQLRCDGSSESGSVKICNTHDISVSQPIYSTR